VKELSGLGDQFVNVKTIKSSGSVD
jgi:hypothetical protein